jgi:hypothetical protein
MITPLDSESILLLIWQQGSRITLAGSTYDIPLEKNPRIGSVHEPEEPSLSIFYQILKHLPITSGANFGKLKGWYSSFSTTSDYRYGKWLKVSLMLGNFSMLSLAIVGVVGQRTRDSYASDMCRLAARKCRLWAIAQSWTILSLLLRGELRIWRT